MKMLRTFAWVSLIVAALVGSLAADRSNEPMHLGNYVVLTADFHQHMMPGDSAARSPFDAVLDAKRAGLDVIALTPHNRMWMAEVGAWFSRVIHGPLVIVGEEVHTTKYHILGLGLHEVVDWRFTAQQTIAAIHQQGGIAVAAHPLEQYWPALMPLRAELDATELHHPVAIQHPENVEVLASFARDQSLALLSDSDSHGTGPKCCFTYVFATDLSVPAVLDAVRKRNTVIERNGSYEGKPELIALIRSAGAQLLENPVKQPLHWHGVLALLALIVLGLVGIPAPRGGSGNVSSV